MPRLSTYTAEELRKKAAYHRKFADRCEAVAVKKEADAISKVLIDQAALRGIEPSRVLDKLSQVQRVEPLPNE